MAKDSEDKGKSFLSGYMGRFKSNMADYFDENENPFDFTKMPEPGKVDVGEGQSPSIANIFPNFKKDYGPQQGAIGLQGTTGTPGFFQQIAGPIAGAAAKSLFACDMRLKHDVDCLTDMNLVKDDLADVAYFVKELQDS